MVGIEATPLLYNTNATRTVAERCWVAPMIAQQRLFQGGKQRARTLN